MGDADKPFCCTAPGCGMRFVSEDHLTVHKKKHEMSLCLASSSVNKNFVDQTPTPTRFIRNCDAVGLFQELQHLNPFDEDFRKATQSGCSLQVTDPAVTNADGDSLNTPTVIPLTTERQIIPTSEPEPQEIIFPVEEMTVPVEEEMAESQPFSSCEPEGEDTIPSQEVPPVKENLSQPTSVITHSTNVSRLPKKATNISTVPVVARNDAGAVTTVASKIPTGIPIVTSISSDVIQTSVHPVTLIIKLTDGQVPYMTTSSGITTQPVISSVCKLDAPSHIPATAKLKAAITSRASKVVPCPSKVNAAIYNSLNNKNLLVSRVGPVATVQPTIRSASAGKSRPGTGEFLNFSASAGRRGRDEEDNPDEKRVKFLERNRAAAARCRNRKKQWVVALQRKADELASTNEQLQREVALLRNEVAKLKTMLLAHKDCPITQQQRAAGHSDVVLGMPTLCPPLLSTCKTIETSNVFVDTIEVEISSSDNSCDSKSLPGSSE